MELNENRRKARSVLNYIQRVSGQNVSEKDAKEGIDIANFFSAKNMLLKVNEIPLDLKAEIRENPNTIWDKVSQITEILKKLCGIKSENKKLEKFEDKEDVLNQFLQNIGGGMVGAGESGSGSGNSAGGQGQQSEQGTAEQSQQNQQKNQIPDEQTQQSAEQGDNSQFLDAMSDFFDDTVPEDLKTQFTPQQQEAFDFLCDQIGEEKVEFIKNHEGLLEDTLEAFTKAIYEPDYSKMIKQIVDFNQKMDQVIQIDEMLSPFAQSIGIGINELFQKKGFAELQKYALLAEKQKEIKELAEMLGHQESDEKETDRNARDSITHIESKFHPKPSFRGNIVGFGYSGDIGKVVPTEMALLKNLATEMLFYHKFAEKQLLSYNYEMNLKGDVNDDKRLKKGPIIMAIDTSGSMGGEPEKIAKIVAFAVTKIALKEKRKCFLISFSSSIKVMDLSDFSGSSGLTKLTDFLGHSFNGGTDIEPCMKAALDQLEKNNFENADIMVISDFEMYDFEWKTIERIEKQKETGTKLYSLLIGSYPNKKALSYFDEQWKYQGKTGEKMTFIHDMKNKLK